jgi:IS5 family transposase
MQATFSDLEYASKKKLTRRDRFLGQLEVLTPWAALVAAIEPFYPKGRGAGRPPIGLERMLRMYIAHSTRFGHLFQRHPAGDSSVIRPPVAR